MDKVFDTQDYVKFVGVGCFSESRKLLQSTAPGRQADRPGPGEPERQVNGPAKHKGVWTELGGG